MNHSENFKAPKVSLYLDKYVNESGKRNIVVRVRWATGEARKATNFYVTQDVFDDIKSGSTKKPNRVLKADILTVRDAIVELIEKHAGITPKALQGLFNNTVDLQSSDRLASLFDAKIEELKTMEERTGRSNCIRHYMVGKKRALSFFGNVAMHQITEQRLKDYEYFLLKSGRTQGRDSAWNTIHSYMAQIRHLFNTAIKLKMVPRELYPFGKGLYEVPAETKRNTNYLDALELAKFLEYDSGRNALEMKLKNGEIEPNNEKLTMARKREYALDMWFLMYQLCGLNPIDFLTLRWSNISTDRVITVYRNKTFGSRKSMKQLEIPIEPEAWSLLMKHAKKSLDPNALVFDVLNDSMTVRDRQTKKDNWCESINLHCGNIAKEIGLSKLPKCYTARHSFAYSVLHSTGNKALLQEFLGHAQMATTEHYVHAFEMDSKRQAISGLYKPSRAIAS